MSFTDNARIFSLLNRRVFNDNETHRRQVRHEEPGADDNVEREKNHDNSWNSVETGGHRRASCRARPDLCQRRDLYAELLHPTEGNEKIIQYEAKQGPYRIALVNGHTGIPWREQMIQSARAWADRPENKKTISELRVV